MEPQHISLVTGESDGDFSDGFEEFWTVFMAERLRNWLLKEHAEIIFTHHHKPSEASASF